MELGGEGVSTPDGRSEGGTVGGFGGHDLWVGGAGVKTVHKVEPAALGDAAVERAIGLAKVNLVPADLWDF